MKVSLGAIAILLGSATMAFSADMPVKAPTLLRLLFGIGLDFTWAAMSGPAGGQLNRR